MSKDKVKKIVRKYAKRLEEKNFTFSRIYLFGSYASGEARKWSDIDVAVISDEFEKDWNEKEEFLWKLTLDVDSRIEPLGLTENDYKNEFNPMVAEIKKTGIRIK